MNLNSYLEKIADNAIIRDEEKEKIKTSIESLRERLKSHFGNALREHFVFGSYSRDTILPRNMDVTSDIDYLIVFENNNFEPQTYLDRLRAFADLKYARSEIYQSSPTIVLELHHINIELVPAVSTLLGYKIPGKASGYSKWIDTDPKGFNEELTKTNKEHRNNIRKLIRIMKYWNAQNDYPFESYVLEQQICRHAYSFTIRICGQLKDYIFEFIENFDISQLTTNRKFNAIRRAQQILEEAKSLDKTESENKLLLILGSYLNPKTKTAVDVIQKLLSPNLSLQKQLMGK